MHTELGILFIYRKKEGLYTITYEPKSSLANLTLRTMPTGTCSMALSHVILPGHVPDLCICICLHLHLPSCTLRQRQYCLNHRHCVKILNRYVSFIIHERHHQHQTFFTALCPCYQFDSDSLI